MPRPPPSASPATPTGGQVPAGIVRSWSCRAAYRSPRTRARADDRQAAGHGYGSHRTDIENDTGSRRMSGEAMSPAPDRRLQPASAEERECGSNVVTAGAPDDRLRSDVVEAGVEPLVSLAVLGRVGEDDLALDLAVQRHPCRRSDCHRGPSTVRSVVVEDVTRAGTATATSSPGLSSLQACSDRQPQPMQPSSRSRSRSSMPIWWSMRGRHGGGQALPVASCSACGCRAATRAPRRSRRG